MKCFNCGCDLSEKDFCTGCGVDVGMYKRIMHISNRYYNDGLAKANVRDLSGAVVSLRQSLKFNKNNIEARNLLGLVYFEMGEVVAALSEWVISKNLRPKKNLADDYIEAIQSNPARLDTINQTVKKYNLSLHYCYQDSKDLAIIQLKKVLSMNPRLVQGHQLLALLYMDAEEWEKARRELVKCLKIDANNTTTLSYMKHVKMMLEGRDEAGGTAIKKKKNISEDAITYQSGNETIIQPVNVGETKGASSVLNIFIGLLIGLAVSYFLILPARVESARNNMKQELQVVSENSDAKSATISELEQKIVQLESEKEALDTQIAEYTGANGEGQSVDILMQAATTYLGNGEDTLAVADMLYNVDVDYVDSTASDAYRQLYLSLIGAIGGDAATSLYDKGKTAINQSDYTGAISNLEKAWFFSKHEETPDAEILYELAQAYMLAGESDKAQSAYEQIMREYPDSSAATKAADRLQGDDMPVTSSNTENGNTGNNDIGEEIETEELPEIPETDPDVMPEI